MLLEFLMNLTFNFLSGVLDLFTAFELPLDSIQVLATFCSYGSYIVGSDLLVLFATSVLTRITCRITIGFLIFLWRCLPFT